jgi:alpha-tubulin suppressor-like RCC1 family protein
VWAYSGYSADALDVYYAADASNPSWTLITTLVPTGPGAQTMRANYTLPAGGSTQAVRAAFRYGGSASPCTTDTYDDRDDLAFAVEAAVPSQKAKRLVGGGFHSLLLREDGTVWAWGNNSYGQLGDGTTTVRTLPVRVVGLDNVKHIAAGRTHSLALKNDGTVWAWGFNGYGQLGDGTLTNRNTPVQVLGLSGVVTINSGEWHSLAVMSDGSLRAWGDNGAGQLGDGTYTNRSTPVQVSGLTGVLITALGSSHSLAMKQDGTVWAWGNNDNGQLGDGTTLRRATPVRVVGLSGCLALAGGIVQSLAVKQDGTAWAWGHNSAGQLGDGTSIDRLTPVQVSGLSGVSAVSAGAHHALAMKLDGTVWAWGFNGMGQLGDGTTTNRHSPVQVQGLSQVGSISGGTNVHSLALKQDGSSWAWGYNGYGQLGDGTTTDRYSPVSVLLPLTSSLSYNYSATNTNSAQQNTVNKTFTLNAGDKLEVGTCNLAGASASGDTYLRLYGISGTEVAYNDDNCGGVASYIQYTAPTTGSYEVRAGCYSNNSCGGTVAYKVTRGS